MKYIVALIVLVGVSVATFNVAPTIQTPSSKEIRQDVASKGPETTIVPALPQTIATEAPVKPEVVAEKPVEQPKPEPKPAGSCEAEIAKYDWRQSTALAVSKAESGFNPLVVNNNPETQDYSVGCFQINIYGANAKSRPSEAQLKIPEVNVAFAHKLYSASGRSFIGKNPAKPQWGVCRKKVSCY